MVTSATTHTVDASEIHYELESGRIVSECCEHGSSCRFQLVHSEFSLHATFVALHVDGSGLHLALEDGGGSLNDHAICCVSFPYGTSFCAFLGCLIDVRPQVRGERLVVTTIPPMLTVTNLRRSFRVPVIEQAGLETIVQTPTGRKITVAARDITEDGTEIEIPDNVLHEFSPGTCVSIELKFRGDVVQRTAQVRRIERTRCGLSFNPPPEESEKRGAATMRGIVLSLQQLWLRNRLV